MATTGELGLTQPPPEMGVFAVKDGGPETPSSGAGARRIRRWSGAPLRMSSPLRMLCMSSPLIEDPTGNGWLEAPLGMSLLIT